MWIILGIIVIGCIAGACASYLRDNQNDIGGGLGKKYREDHWGISDKKKYERKAPISGSFSYIL